MVSPVRLLAVSLLLAALAGCADNTSEPTSEPNPSPNPSPTSTSEPVPVLRLGDSGAKVELKTGGTATVSLPASYDWAEPAIDGDAVTVSQDVSDEGSGSRSWTVTGRVAGHATLTLTGSPTCASETPPCAQPDVAWTADFTVT